MIYTGQKPVIPKKTAAVIRLQSLRKVKGE
ncbi:hypothetical protein C808_02781 [Lachnospiraceae bacterium M18-1]|jgi:hypothetical protein|nr:hypothetical protein C808_02781 [Lachnospiraceae bacterium M18-1]